MQNFWQKLPKPIKVLAPMEDVTDTVFRQLIAKWGRPDVFFTEFTNASGLGSEGKENVIHRFKYTETERPIVAQIWGTDAEMHYKSAKMAKDLGFDGVDINMGCPVAKIIKKGGCSALINNQPLAKELIQATKEGANGIPVSVKTRIGFKTIQTQEWIEFLLNQNIAALTVHGRIAISKKEKPADWNEIAKAVEIRNKLKLETVIIGNGDITSLDDLENKAKEFKVDGGMVGRGIFANVFLFNKNKHINDLDLNERLDLVKQHIELFEQTWGDKKNFSILKRFFKIYVSNLKNAAEIRNQLMLTKNYTEALSVVEDLKNKLKD